MSEFEHIVIQLLQELVNDQKKAVTLLEGFVSSDKNDSSKWLTPEKAMKCLTVSKRTLYNLRKKNELTWIRKGKQYRYYEPDIFKIRDHHLK